ncbi:MAG TPA: metallophosphoesterase [Candidatus Binatia bacterium]|nr:metallophosphoesterase [Candidatus Binatia bacterium]
MNEADVLYTSDLHGSRSHYEAAFRMAGDLGVRAVVLGGDLAPMGDPGAQRQFFQDFLIPLLRERLAAPGAPQVFYIFGNGDWRANEAVLEESRLPGLRYVHGGAAPFLDGTWIAGQNCVPPTPIRLKDWERWEVVPGALGRPDGQRSAPDGTLHEFTFQGREREETLDGEMERLEAAVRGATGASEAAAVASQALVCVFHGPPHDTALDQIAGGAHVGSRVTRRFLERMRPALSLHGHIHESPSVSGRFADRVGATVCVNPGQTPAALHAVSFRMADIAGTLRHTLHGPANLAEPR